MRAIRVDPWLTLFAKARRGIQDELRRWTWCRRCLGQRYLGKRGLPVFWERRIFRDESWNNRSIICPRCGDDSDEERRLINILHDMEA